MLNRCFRPTHQVLDDFTSQELRCCQESWFVGLGRRTVHGDGYKVAPHSLLVAKLVKIETLTMGLWWVHLLFECVCFGGNDFTFWKPAWWYCLGHSSMIQPGSSQSAWRCSWEWLLYQCPMSLFGIWTLVVQFHFGSILDLRLDRCIIKWSQGFPNASTILTVEGISCTVQYAQSFLLWVNGQSVNRPLSSTVTAIAKAQHV